MGPKLQEVRGHWAILLASFAGIMLGWALPLFVLGPITPSLIDEFGWSPASVVMSASLFAVGAAIGSPMVGWLADRFDARAIAGAALTGLAAGLAGIGMLSGAVWQLHLLYLLMGFIGAGTGAIIYTRAIGAKFVEARGMAIAIALSGTGVTSLFVPLFAAEVTASAGWRAVGPAIGATVLLFALPLVLVGLTTARRPASADAAFDPDIIAASGMTRPLALRDSRFHLLGLSICIYGVFSGIPVLTIVPALQEAGATPARAAQTASLLGIAIIVGRLGVGWLLDRYPAALVGAGMFALGSLGAFLFTTGSADLAIAAILLMGLLLGAEVDMMSYMTLHYFGVRSFGEIFGLLMLALNISTIGGPLAAAALLASGAGYAAVFGLAGGSFLIVAVILLILAHIPNGR